ncbi:hypothetical protein CVT25_009731 [Psilocybe cyanescens]|uniref:Uncharacterized protein n=1 Tax=Psilocybe cyanescens TaxID=93625 RepID=A0A409XGQ5_PSICY|nr:hypothetical protein CVT25_009731 [Psilocybe cyanescens]
MNALHAEKLTDSREARNRFCEHVRLLFQEIFRYEKEEDYTAHEPPLPSTIINFEKSSGPGPNLDDLLIDMRGKISSEWNVKVAELLLENFLEYKANWEGDDLTLPERSDAYFLDLITEKLGRVKVEWGRTRARFKPDGSVETPFEVEARMEKNKDGRGEASRAYSRRVQIIEIKKAEGAEDLEIWAWIQTVVQKLGEEGTSSDESGVDEETGYAVFNVRKMPWRRNIEKLLTAIQRAEAVANASRDKRGAKPAHRIRANGNLNSRRDPKKELPRQLYDPKWLKEQNKYVLANLKISKDKLQWIEWQELRRRS